MPTKNWPFGKDLWVLSWFAGVLIAGCASTEPFFNACRPPDWTLEVSSEADGLLRGATCLIRRRAGDTPCPATDDIGRTCISRSRLLGADVQVVQVCGEGHFCGAMKVQEDRDYLERADLTLLSLAPRKPARAGRADFCPEGELAIEVADPDGNVLPGATVELLEDVLQPAAKTGDSGRICLAAQRGLAAKAVIVCHRAFFCALLRPADLPAAGGSLRLPLARYVLP